MTAKQFIKRIKAGGWEYDHSHGGHDIFKHTTKIGNVPVPNHKGDIPIGTLRDLYRRAGLDWSQR